MPELFLQLACWVLDSSDTGNQDIAETLVVLWTQEQYEGPEKFCNMTFMRHLLEEEARVKIAVKLLSRATSDVTRSTFLKMLFEFSATDEEGIALRALLSCGLLEALYVLLFQVFNLGGGTFEKRLKMKMMVVRQGVC